MKLFKKILIWLFATILILVLGVFIAFKVSVKPGVYIIQNMFDQPIEVLDQERYSKTADKVNIIEDVQYTSNYENNYLDIYYPKALDQAKGVLFWVHGGGFVAGEKEAIGEFATYIAAENELAVIAIDYETAPDLNYPGQVFQLDDAYHYLLDSQDDYPMLDFSNVLFGGDSAGAQISGQYTALQTNADYAAQLAFKPSIDMENIVAFISYSGPVDIRKMKDVKSNNLFMKFFVNTVARAFIGTSDWKNSAAIEEASIAKYVTADFPATYITDGNAFSFPDQGKALADKLADLDIPVKSLFYFDSDEEIPHEYQFDYRRDEAKQSLKETIDFINEHLK